ncbi:plastid lipid-associated PAP/fibrillin family protein [Nitzschia inconspicua]|uniref:Plastid lipid-associated PAP/fibrillin family protein n=1 Tax=Nitzschia inconspicua TaxID=303405 RepID=A0A9K3L4N8_9STRA|nr:plastid lipid-associated PAP/fibrillin family protein [Nitzschia inconspicua]
MTSLLFRSSVLSNGTCLLHLLSLLFVSFTHAFQYNGNTINPQSVFLQQQQQRRPFHPFSLSRQHQQQHHNHHHRVLYSSVPSDVSSSPYETLDDIKADLLRTCKGTTTDSNNNNNNKPSLANIQDLVSQLEDMGEQMGVGQSSAITGILAGEWELLYSPEDVTRSSPFFWAFAQAFPEQADQIFGITDSIPSPIKDVGPAYQSIQLDETGRDGKLISKVKVSTLNGMATSIMTTRADIVQPVGVDGLMLRVDTTKPEDSTAIATLFPGPLGRFINDNAPPFPSGDVLERIQPGSSTVIMRTTFCDESIRISRNDNNQYALPYVWRRCKFAGSETI